LGSNKRSELENMSENTSTEVPASVQEAILVASEFEPSKDDIEIRGVDFLGLGDTSSLDKMMKSFLSTGFQATNVGHAIERINDMLKWRLSDIPIKETDSEEMRSPEFRKKTKCKIFLSYTSNMISSGVRETIKFLVQHKLVDVIVTTAGGIEEDFIKCLAPTYLGDFKLSGKELRKKGVNRIGNLLVPNKNYCLFEDWLSKILHTMTDEQVSEGKRWSPSKIIARLGKEIDNEDSVYYWAQKNNIPVFCPAITDGSLGDMMYFHNYKRPEFSCDIVDDIRAINDIAVRAPATGMIILGGGLVKHHTCNANLMRNGADFSVFINTGQEFDGSDSGASPDEAVSWGKVKMDSHPVKVSSDATLVFPLIVSQTFLPYLKNQPCLE
jgi:deoxyhypusine synthase